MLAVRAYGQAFGRDCPLDHRQAGYYRTVSPSIRSNLVSGLRSRNRHGLALRAKIGQREQMDALKRLTLWAEDGVVVEVQR